jgi:hypothetical protein
MIPEFTAEAALAAHRPYHMTAKTPAGGDATISPQLSEIMARRGGGGGALGGLGGPLEAITQCVCPCCIQVAGRLFCCD